MTAVAEPDRAAGFTLLELLVASVVLGLIALVIVNGTRFITRALAHAQSRREAVESMVTGLGLVRGELGQAEPITRRIDNRNELLFAGSEDRLRFVAVSPEYLPGWPLVAYEYAIVQRDGRTLLELRRATLEPDTLDLAVLDGAEARTLLAFPNAVRFAYFGRLEPKERDRWHEAWAAAKMLPLAVRIGPAGDEAGWPDFVLPVRVNTPPACVDANAKETPGCG